MKYIMEIILASASPRRHELLKQIELVHTIEISDVEEEMNENSPPHEIVTLIAMQKAIAVADKHRNDDCIIIGADTIVMQDNCLLGKPKDFNEAKEMLKRLQGSSHFVLTGIAIIQPKSGIIASDYQKTKVTFCKMTEHEIDKYIQTGEPMDKAGAYGIQGIGSKYITEIEGDFFNVVGLPIRKLTTLLEKRFGFKY